MKVTVYSTKWCQWCRKLRAFMYANSIKFEDKDVDHVINLEELVKHTGEEWVPVTIIEDKNKDKKIVKGFEPRIIKDMLKLKR